MILFWFSILVVVWSSLGGRKLDGRDLGDGKVVKLVIGVKKGLCGGVRFV